MSGHIHIAGHYYQPFHQGWGGFSDELFHYTSRYYAVTEAFLRQLSGQNAFVMSGYKAAMLSDQQRHAMAGVLGYPPDRNTAQGLVGLVESVLQEDEDYAATLLQRYPVVRVDLSEDTPDEAPKAAFSVLDIGPLDPWLSLAARLQMAVAIHDHHVAVDMKVLARHLDSANAVVRSNLQQAIIELHQAGYVLHNHPHLTHAEAQALGDEGAV